MKFWTACAVGIIWGGLQTTAASSELNKAGLNQTALPKNIILMIGDGMGPAHIAAYRIFADDPETPELDSLIFDPYLVGSLSTEPFIDDPAGHYWVTDSAASATAYSSGIKTYNGAIAYQVRKQPSLTVLEAAKRHQQKVGLVATSQIVHATPAAFIAHVESRQQYNDIADQFLDNRWQGQPILDVFLGGGWRYFQRDDRNLINELQQESYQVIRTATELVNTKAPLAGLFAEVALPEVLDRTPEHPSLAEMTTSAINNLKHPRGFFLMVEGSQIDWASHANDVAGMLHEMDDFHQAVTAAIKFAHDDGETLVLVTADHETGGFSIGHRYDGKSHYKFNPSPVAGLKQSIQRYAEQALHDKSMAHFITDLGAEITAREILLWNKHLSSAEPELETIKDLFKQIINRVTYSGWTTNGHTGVDVNLYAYGPGAEYFRGHHLNTFIGKTLLNWILASQTDIPE